MAQVAASLAAALFGASEKDLTEVAQSAGGEDQDPWPALLRYAKLTKKLKTVLGAASSAIAVRRKNVDDVEFPNSMKSAARSKSPNRAHALDFSEALRNAETSILDSASRMLKDFVPGGKGPGLA